MPSWVKLGCQNGEEMKRKGVEMREAAGKKKGGRVFVGGHITAGSSHEAAVIGGLHRRPKPPTGGDAQRWHHRRLKPRAGGDSHLHRLPQRLRPALNATYSRAGGDAPSPPARE